jgi:hypothetical protein
VDWGIAFQILGAAVGAYVAVRAELAYLRAKVERVEKSVDTAHRRIDNLLMKEAK